MTVRDGYYWVSTGCIIAGAIVLVLFVQPAARKLQGAFSPFLLFSLLEFVADVGFWDCSVTDVGVEG